MRGELWKKDLKAKEKDLKEKKRNEFSRLRKALKNKGDWKRNQRNERKTAL